MAFIRVNVSQITVFFDKALLFYQDSDKKRGMRGFFSLINGGFRPFFYIIYYIIKPERIF